MGVADGLQRPQGAYHYHNDQKLELKLEQTWSRHHTPDTPESGLIHEIHFIFTVSDQIRFLLHYWASSIKPFALLLLSSVSSSFNRTTAIAASLLTSLVAGVFTVLQQLISDHYSTSTLGPTSFSSQDTDWSCHILTWYKKTIQTGLFQDGAARFQIWNLCNPAALEGVLISSYLKFIWFYILLHFILNEYYFIITCSASSTLNKRLITAGVAKLSLLRPKLLSHLQCALFQIRNVSSGPVWSVSLFSDFMKKMLFVLPFGQGCAHFLGH